MMNFFAILLVIFIGILLIVFKKRSFKKLINKSNLYSIKLNKNNKFSSNKNGFFYNHEEKKYSVFYLSSDLQTEEMFIKRKPLSSSAKRAGWQGYYFDGELLQNYISRLI